jgi:hypothetical protein
MIRPNPAQPDTPFADDARVAEALTQARIAATRRHAAAGLPLLDWKNGLLLTTDAIITEIKEKKKAPAGGGMDDMDY